MFVQIVQFKLKPDASRELFLELAEQMITWLKDKDGFVAYELYEGSEVWSDRIAWTEQRLAEEGLAAFLKTATANKLIHLVEEGYGSFFGKLVMSAKNEHKGCIA